MKSLTLCWTRLHIWGSSAHLLESHLYKTKLQPLIRPKLQKNIAELQSFVGLANYLRQFIPSFAEIMSPLYKLLQKNINWRWGAEEEQAFVKIKASITSEQVLRHYDPSAPLVLQVNAS